MKTTMILAIIALATGCSAPKPAPKTARVAPEPIVLPAVEEAPPGTMDVDWEPKEPPAPKPVEPKKLKAKPEMVAPTKAGRLFVLPTSASKE
jgi:hypothetical protein